jgi:two-component system chemotaxis response regulator CheB
VTPLKKDLPAAIFIVHHLSATSSVEIQTDILQRNTELLCKVAEEGEHVKAGHIYLPQVDHHMLLVDGHIHLTRGPRENGFRPSIDTLFRSAAAYYGSQVIGVLLTGMLYDGTVGMEAIKRSGGLTLVQDPQEAAFPTMPRTVLQHIEVNYVLPVAEIGIMLEELVHRQPSLQSAPEDIKAEAQIAERVMTETANVEKLGERSVFICPDCGGPLWEMNHGDVPRYRCHTGHAHLAETLLYEKDKQLEETLWIAMRILEERKNMLVTLTGQPGVSERIKSIYEDKIEEARSHIERIKKILLTDFEGLEALRKKDSVESNKGE